MAFKVLIVDDSPAMRKFIKRVLDLTGLEISECLNAGDGQQALDIMADNWVDIVLTDINMPIMNGEQLMEHISSNPILSTIPVMVISTDQSGTRLARMMSLGAKEYVTKPFIPEVLGDAMQRLLTGRANENA